MAPTAPRSRLPGPQRLMVAGLASTFVLAVLASWSDPLWARPSSGPAGQTVPRPTSTPTPTVTPGNTATPTATPTLTPTPVAVATLLPDQTTLVDATLATRAAVKLEVPASTFPDLRQMTVADVPRRALPPPPPGVREIRKPFEVAVFLPDGSRDEHPALGRCVTLSATPGAEDLAAATGGLASLALLRYDGLTRAWIVLTTQANVVTNTLSAQVCSTLSLFGIGVFGSPDDATPTPTVFPPIPGDGRPPTPLVLLAMAAGVLLTGVGLLLLRTGRPGDRRAR